MATLVLSRLEAEKGDLPAFCLRCGRPAAGYWPRRFRFTRGFVLRAPLCRWHCYHWTWPPLLAGLGAPAAIASLAVGYVLLMTIRDNSLWILAGGVLVILGAIITLVVVLAYMLLRVTSIRVVDSDLQTVTLQGISESFLETYQRHQFERREASAAALANKDQNEGIKEERIQCAPGKHAEPGTLHRPLLEFSLNRDDHLAHYMHLWEKRRRSPAGRWRAGLLILMLGGPVVVVSVYFIVHGLLGLILPQDYVRFAAPGGALLGLLIVVIDLSFGISEHGRIIRERRSHCWWVKKFVLPRYEAQGLIDPSAKHQLWIDAGGVREINLSTPALVEGAKLQRRDEAHVAWAAIEEVAETPQQALLILRNRYAFIIPKSAFPSEAAFADFVDEAREHLEAERRARSVEPPSYRRG
jgi:hypothetical protein